MQTHREGRCHQLVTCKVYFQLLSQFFSTMTIEWTSFCEKMRVLSRQIAYAFAIPVSDEGKNTEVVLLQNDNFWLTAAKIIH